MPKPVRVLHIVGAIAPGGLENFIMNLYEQIDREQVQFDVIIHARKENDYVEQIEAMGGKVYTLPRLTSKPIQNLIQIYRIVKKQQYPVVVRHTPNALVTPQLLVARLGGAKTICHSHSVTDPQKTAHKLGRLLMKVATTNRVACSEAAGKWMFGKQDYEIVQNAINIQKFEYSKEKEQKVREEFKLADKKVYGHIGNFAEVKNHMYLLSIYKEILDRDKNAVCFCLGEGSLRTQIEAEIERLGIADRVILTGVRHDAENFMSCFDVLIFPSIFEGLPLTLIEAQAAGLPCLISDAITKEVVVTEHLVEMRSIKEPAELWAKRAVEIANQEELDRSCQYELIAKHGYDIKKLAKWYEQYFKKL